MDEPSPLINGKAVRHPSPPASIGKSLPAGVGGANLAPGDELWEAVVDIPILRTVCGPNALTAIVDAVTAVWAWNTWIPETIRNQVDIAVAEIAANIVEHAGSVTAATVEMRITVHPDQVEIAFTDTGVQADIDLDNVQMPDELAERGRGLPLAKAVLAQLAYHRSERDNHWTLVSRAFR